MIPSFFDFDIGIVSSRGDVLILERLLYAIFSMARIILETIRLFRHKRVGERRVDEMSRRGATVSTFL